MIIQHSSMLDYKRPHDFAMGHEGFFLLTKAFSIIILFLLPEIY